MQAEDIIQTKEWHQLNDAEKKIVVPLASTEREYNVLKKMLLVAQEDAHDVPLISPSVQQNIKAHLNKKEAKGSGMIWYAAAASIIIIVLAYFFLLQTNDPKENLVVKRDKSLPQKSLIDTPIQKQLQNLPVPVPPTKDVAVNHQTDTISNYKNSPKKTQTNRDNLVNPNDIAINTSVSANTNLLKFVTEVY